jgi:hypothetical protein
MPFLPWVAAGVSYHRLMGRDREMLSLDYDNADRPSAVVYQDTTETVHSGGYVGASLWMTRPDWDLGLWVDAPGNLSLEVHHDYTSEFTNVSVSDSSTTTPLTMGVGTALRLNPHQTVVADARYTDWTPCIAGATREYYLGAGWEYQGKGDRFDSYWKRMAYRLGGYVDMGGASDLSTVAATTGVGIPLGNVGTIDLAFQVGHTYNPPSQPQLEETFYRVYVSLTGVSLWGNPSRRRQ